MDTFLLILRISLSLIFLLAALGKLMDREGSEKALHDFEVPEKLIRPLALLLPWVEIAVAFSLVLTSVSWFGAIGAGVLLASFTAGMAVQYSKGNAPDCHCFGQIHSEPVSPRSIIRNAVLLVPAIILVASGQRSQGFDLTSLDGGGSSGVMTVIIGTIVIALLAASLVMLWKVIAQQGLILRRIEILEVLSGEGREVERDEAIGRPHAGLPLGSPLPTLELIDGSGSDTDSGFLRDGQIPSLILFVGPNCHPCESLIPDIKKWAADFEGSLRLVLVSSGPLEENQKKFSELGPERLFVLKDRASADLLGAMWTPTALLLDRNGRVASRSAVGDTAIKDMVEALSGADLSTEYLHYLSDDEREGSRIGQPVPDFTLSDLEGRTIASSEFSGRQTLAAFWSTTCPFCINMIEDLKDWYSSRSEAEPELVVFSDGDPERHKELGLAAPILLEKEYVTASKLGMNGTPSAVLIDENGRIASETGVGADMIWALLGRTKSPASESNGK